MQKLVLDMVALKERKDGSAASAAAASSGEGSGGGFQSGLPMRVGYGGRPSMWTPTRLELKGWGGSWNDVSGGRRTSAFLIGMLSIRNRRDLMGR